jgi:hypothetical protein
MGLLQSLDDAPAHLKAGFQGFQKSGKTYTAIDLAIGTRAFFKLEGPVGFFDTEGGSAYLRDKVKAQTGKPLVGMRSRSFDDLMAISRECLKEKVSVLVVDSVTHIWKDVCESYLDQVNQLRKSKGWSAQKKLEFQDWSAVKRKWGDWTDFYLNSPMHIIICGRAGYEYDMEKDAETGKRELQKTGIKMKAEGEFGFEPSLLVQMEQVPTASGKVHRAIVLGDRFGVIDGKVADNPTFEFFKPFISRLVPGSDTSIDMRLKTNMGIEDDGAEYHRNKKIMLDLIKVEFERKWPGSTKEEKVAKADASERVFGTRSWLQLETYRLGDLKLGYEQLCELTGGPGALAATPSKEITPEEMSEVFA